MDLLRRLRHSCQECLGEFVLPCYRPKLVLGFSAQSKTERFTLTMDTKAIENILSASNRKLVLAANEARKVFVANPGRVYLAFTTGDASDAFSIRFGKIPPAALEDGLISNDIATAPQYSLGPSELCWKGEVWIFAAGVMTVNAMEYDDGLGLAP